MISQLCIFKSTTVLQVSLVVMNRSITRRDSERDVVKGHLKSKIGCLKYGNGRNNQIGWEAEEDKDYRALRTHVIQKQRIGNRMEK